MILNHSSEYACDKIKNTEVILPRYNVLKSKTLKSKIVKNKDGYQTLIKIHDNGMEILGLILSEDRKFPCGMCNGKIDYRNIVFLGLQ